MDFVYTSEDFQSQKCSSTQVHTTFTTAVHWCKSKIKLAIFVSGPFSPSFIQNYNNTRIKVLIFTTQLLFFPIIYNPRRNQTTQPIIVERARSSIHCLTELLPVSYLAFLSHEKGHLLTQQEPSFTECLVLARTFVNKFIHYKYKCI